MKNLLYGIPALCLLAIGMPSRANVNAVDTSRVVDLDEISVTAQPKEQMRLRLQPISSNLLDAAAIKNLGVRDIRELSLFVHSFAMPDYGSRYT